MDLNPINDNFEVRLPDNLILPSVIAEFSKLLQGRHLIHDDLMSYISESLQSVSVPDFIGQPINIKGAGYQMNKRPATNDLFRIGDFATTLTFRVLDGMWNYWMFRKSYFDYIKNADKKLNYNLGNLTLVFYSNDKSFSYNVTFVKCIFGGVEGKAFSYVNDEIGNAEYISIGLVYDDFVVTVNLPEFNNIEDDSNGLDTDILNDFDDDGISDITTSIHSTGNVNSQPGANDEIIVN